MSAGCPREWAQSAGERLAEEDTPQLDGAVPSPLLDLECHEQWIHQLTRQGVSGGFLLDFTCDHLGCMPPAGYPLLGCTLALRPGFASAPTSEVSFLLAVVAFSPFEAAL